MQERLKKPMLLLQMLFGKLQAGFFTIWAKHKDGRKITHWYDPAAGVASIEQAAEKAIELDAQGFDVYVSTCPARTRGGSNSRINQNQVCSVPALYMDCDAGKKNCPTSKDELREKLLALPAPPSLLVDSGGGYHAYWLLAVAIPVMNPADLAHVKSLMKGFAGGVAALLGYTGFDLGASEPARELRVPGTHNHKGSAPAPVGVIHAGEPYMLDDLTAYIKPDTPKAPPVSLAKTPPKAAQEPPALSDRQILARARAGKHGERFARLWNGQWEGEYKSQSEADIALCNSLAFWTGGDAGHTDALFRQSGLYRSEKWDEMHGAQTYGKKTIADALDSTTTFYDPNYKLLAEHPEAYRLVSEDIIYNAKRYEVPAKYVRFGKPPSEALREAARQKAAHIRRENTHTCDVS